MSDYRCASCGSPNVLTDTKKEGYSYTKGAIGSAILGSGGAVAGIDGKTITVYKCPDCGMTLNYPMDDVTKQIIDLGVSVPSMRNELKINGTPVVWEYYTSKYKNININQDTKLQEEINAIIENTEKMKAEIKQMNFEFSLGVETKDFSDAVISRYQELVKGINQNEPTFSPQEQERWDKQYENLKAKFHEEYSKLELSYQKKLQDLDSQQKKEADEINEKVKVLEKEAKEIEALIASTPAIKFLKVKGYKQQLIQQNYLIEKTKNSVKWLDQDYNKKKEEAEATLNEEIDALIITLPSYHLGVSPSQKIANFSNLQKIYADYKGKKREEFKTPQSYEMAILIIMYLEKSGQWITQSKLTDILTYIGKKLNLSFYKPDKQLEESAKKNGYEYDYKVNAQGVALSASTLVKGQYIKKIIANKHIYYSLP